MANLKGCDISKWQAVGAGDGYDFVIVKATEGVGYTDPNFRKHIDRAIANGQLVGAYHFARPNASEGNTAVAEANSFVNEVRPYIEKAILVLDWEAENVHNVAWAKEWLDTVYELTNVRPLIYMSASVIKQYDWSSVADANYGLWVAGYPAKYNVANPETPTPDDIPWSVKPWPFWAIWQYSSGAGSFDYDIANFSTIDVWSKYAAKNGEVPTIPKTEVVPVKKTSEEIADEVEQGLWGNFPERQPKLEAAGYDYNEIQGIVNKRYEQRKSQGVIVEGSKVLPKTFVDVNGTPLRKSRDYYIATNVRNGKALLVSGSQYYAWIAIDNLQLV